MSGRPHNVQSGRPTAETTFDDPPRVASAAEREGVHYEPDPDQLMKVVHQVRPDTLPVDSPTDYERQAGAEDASIVDARVTPGTASVHEALPPDDGQD